jgi:PPOX class probable F420-dependent enzyme
MTKRQRDAFLRGRRVAVLVTIGADGAPVPTPIWYLYRDGAFYFRTAGDARKTENVRRNPRVSICVQDERPPYKALVAYGEAQISEERPWLRQAMPRRYLGVIGAIGYQSAAREAIEAGTEITLSVRPDRFTSFDFAADTPVYGRAWLLLKRVLPSWL